MYTNFYVYTALRLYMSGKLYWRYKKNGKWTWSPVIWVDHEKDSIQELINELRILPPEEEQ